MRIWDTETHFIWVRFMEVQVTTHPDYHLVHNYGGSASITRISKSVPEENIIEYLELSNMEVA